MLMNGRGLPDCSRRTGAPRGASQHGPCAAPAPGASTRTRASRARRDARVRRRRQHAPWQDRRPPVARTRRRVGGSAVPAPRRHYDALVAALTHALLALSLAAQEPAAPAPTVELVVHNLAAHARREWIAAAVPFAAGAVPAGDLPDLHVDGIATVWQPFGARWPDGSLRQALCLFEMPLDPSSETRVLLVPGHGPELPPGEVVVPEGLRIVFEHEVAGQRSSAEAARAEVLEENAARRVELWRCRLGTTGLVCEAILTAWRGQAHLGADVGVFFSDPRNPAMSCPIDSLSVRTHGLALVLRHRGRFAMRTVENERGDGSTTLLLRDTQLGDGQGIRRAGVLVPRLDG